jgi:hypothetical protein
MFFNKAQIAQSLAQLQDLDPFFGTTFLALKEVTLPVGTTVTISLTATLEAFLQRYYRPFNDYDDFYFPFALYHSKKKHWASNHYARNLQNSAKERFPDALIHAQGKQAWGWQNEYIQNLLQNHLFDKCIPAFDLAVWLFRSRNWNSRTATSDVIEAFFSEFRIQPEERVLFADAPRSDKFAHDERVISPQELVELIGVPEGKKVVEKGSKRVSSYEMIPLFSSLSTLAEYGARLQQLKLREVGPAKQIELNLAPRLNLITGDNALGKTFLLECAWWALTGTWASKYPAYPLSGAQNPGIAFQIGKEYQSHRLQEISYNWRAQKWAGQKNRSILPGLSIFCQADGAFAVWDPAKLENPHEPDLYNAYSGICAYTCHWTPYDTGWKTVEHFRPKELYPQEAYLWANYRFVCGTLNGRKGINEDILDPFALEEGWFTLHFPSLQLMPGKHIKSNESARVEKTIKYLKLNDWICVRARRDWLLPYLRGKYPIDFLAEKAPFLAKELRRQRLEDLAHPMWKTFLKGEKNS